MQTLIPPSISIEHYQLAYQKRIIFADLNLTISPGKWLGLLGLSGVGKTSLLRIIAGILPPQVSVSGHLGTDSPIPLRQQVTYLAQTDLLLPWLTVLSNTIIGYKLRDEYRNKAATIREKAISLLNQVGLGKSLHLYPEQLSGGMRQRVALVRTIMEDRPIVLMDEPFSAVDTITKYKLQILAAELLKNKTVIFVTHDPLEALRLANEIYLLEGTPATIRKVIDLTTANPREVNTPDMVALSTTLFKELAQAAEAQDEFSNP